MVVLTTLLGCLLLVIGLTSVTRSSLSLPFQQPYVISHNYYVNNGENREYVKYPPRKDMGACPPWFGKVVVLVVMVQSSYDT